MRAPLVVVGVVFAAACVPFPAQFVATNKPPRALEPRRPDEVEVFTTTTPQKPYVEVGIVTARSKSDPPASKGAIIEGVRAEAAKQGCDGLIFAPGGPAFAEATCIVYK